MYINLTSEANDDNAFLMDIVPFYSENDPIVYKKNSVWFYENYFSKKEEKKDAVKVKKYSFEISPASKKLNYVIHIPAAVKHLAVFVSYRNNLNSSPVILDPYESIQVFFHKRSFYIPTSFDKG